MEVADQETSIIARMQNWYVGQCDGEWEHSYGVEINTLDNPGWIVKIDLPKGAAPVAPWADISERRSATNWIHCRIEENQFRATGGVQNLCEMLTAFLDAYGRK